MRPLYHPSAGEITVEGILHALADPTRVAIYARIVASEQQFTCSSFLKVCDREIPKSTLSVHFRTLREAGLIRSERHGVEVRNTSRCAEIEARFPGLLPAILGAHQAQQAAKAAGAKPPARSRARR